MIVSLVNTDFVIIFGQILNTDLDCQYKYTEQLPPNPSCEPYTMCIMKIECTAEVPRNASDVSIGWFLDCVELTNDSHMEISVQVQDAEMTGIRRIRSRLTISPITDEYAGGYTCNLLGDDEYIPSDIFTLRDSMYYDLYSPLIQCDDSGDVFANAWAAQKCADITENRTIPMSLSCAEPPATTSHDTPVTSTLVVYTSPPPSSSSPTPSTSSHPHSLIISPTITVMFTTTPQKDPPTSLPGDHSTSHSLAAVCAVLIMIIILLVVTFVLVKLCRRQSSRITVNGQNLTCESLYSEIMMNQLCTLYFLAYPVVFVFVGPKKTGVSFVFYIQHALLSV